MIPSCLVQAAKDPAIRGATLSLYVLLFEYLSAQEHRPAKLASLARELGVKEPMISKSIRILVDRGYLARGQDDGAMRTYLLELSPRRREVEKVSLQESIRSA